MDAFKNSKLRIKRERVLENDENDEDDENIGPNAKKSKNSIYKRQFGENVI
jgi:hypothetical protein